MQRLPLLIGILFTIGASPVAKPADNTSPSLARPPKLSDLFGDEVLARGKGVEVRQSLVDQAYISWKATMGGRGETIPEERRLPQEAQLLERLIITQLLTNRVTQSDRTNAQAIADRFLAESKKNRSEEDFQRQLKAVGLTPGVFERRLLEQSLSDAVVQRELRAKVNVTDAQVKDFYTTGTDVLVKAMESDLEKAAKDRDTTPQMLADFKERIDNVRKTNLGRLQQPEQVKVMHVFMTIRDRQTEQELPEDAKLEKRRRMERIRERALAGEEFAKLVMEFSEDRGVKETRGEYTFPRDAPFAEEFKAASFSLAPGKFSDVVSTPYGYHVIKLIERTPAQKVELDKVAKELKDFLTQQEVLRAMPEFFNQIKKDAGVEVLNAKYRSVLQELQRSMSSPVAGK